MDKGFFFFLKKLENCSMENMGGVYQLLDNMSLIQLSFSVSFPGRNMTLLFHFCSLASQPAGHFALFSPSTDFSGLSAAGIDMPVSFSSYRREVGVKKWFQVRTVK